MPRRVAPKKHKHMHASKKAQWKKRRSKSRKIAEYTMRKCYNKNGGPNFFHRNSAGASILTAWQTFVRAVFSSITGVLCLTLIPSGIPNVRFSASSTTKREAIDSMGKFYNLPVDKPQVQCIARPGSQLNYVDSMSSVLRQDNVKIVETPRINVSSQNTAESSR
jgi:hypothetical protein